MEIWKDIPCYEGCYKVSNLGNVKSFKRKKGILRKAKVSSGYYAVTLYSNGKGKQRMIHSLVAETFLNHTPSRFLVVDHINNIKTDNRLENLQVITARENTSKDRKGYSSDYVGVSYYKTLNKWTSDIWLGTKNKRLGYFETEIEAHEAYQRELNKIKE